MNKRFSLTLMSTVLPSLLASCVDAPAQTYTQPAQQVIVPEGCELEQDGEVDCDGDSVKVKGRKASKTAAAVAGAVAARAASRSGPVNTASSVSRGGLTSSARASSSSGGYGG
ncbi:hypothetical protein K7W42_01545 [Deinococcus sp. HMF7604]|uniref:hypothetical protein n=1 Tax=Deinococcus betulae TaxID=2873312 RepID=UPI001CCA6F1F|nr:hypothetical protein [Deinococcus betulae]MBZ9749538.1 hypothetical protein [Deinococcus betulae]